MIPPRVALVEDHLLLAETLCAGLRLRGFDAVGYPPVTLAALSRDLLAGKPDLVLLDLDLGECGTSESLVAPLTAAGIDVLVVTGSPDRLAVATALELGAVGWQSKTAGFDALIAAAAGALAPERHESPERDELLAELRAARSARDSVDAAFAGLTEREDATLGALSDGLTVHEIARDWVVSEATVRSHVRGVLVKLGVTSQLAAVARAHQTGWARRR